MLLISFITSVRQRATIPRTEKMATLGHPKSGPKNAKEDQNTSLGVQNVVSKEKRFTENVQLLSFPYVKL